MEGVAFIWIRRAFVWSGPKFRSRQQSKCQLRVLCECMVPSECMNETRLR